MTEFDWLGYVRAMQKEHHWTAGQAMTGQTFHQVVCVLEGVPKFTVTAPAEAAGEMESLRDQINRKRAAKGLPPMKPAKEATGAAA